jgi:chlorite dismutase
MELRETQGSIYVERDTPIFTCMAMSLEDTVGSLGI